MGIRYIMLRYTSILFYNEHVLNTCLILLNMNMYKKAFDKQTILSHFLASGMSFLTVAFQNLTWNQTLTLGVENEVANMKKVDCYMHGSHSSLGDSKALN